MSLLTDAEAPPFSCPSGVAPRAAARRPRRGDALALLGLLLLAAVLRLRGLGATSLYRDDAWSVLVTRMHGLGELRWVMVTAPGFELLLWGEGLLFGSASLAAQAPAWVAGVVLAPLCFLAGRARGVARCTALLAGLVMATAFVAVQCSLRAKPYTCDALAALVLLVLLGRIERRGASTRDVAMVAVVAVGTLLVSLSSVPVVAGAGVGLALLLGPRRWRALTAVGVPLIATALSLRWSVVVQNPGRRALAEFWQPTLLGQAKHGIPSGFLSGLHRLLDGLDPLPVPLPGWLATALGALVLIGVHSQRRAGWVLVLPTAFCVGASLMDLAPLGGGRVDLGLYPGLVLAAAHGLDVLVRWRRPSVVLAPLAATVCVSLATLLATAWWWLPDVALDVYPREQVRPMVRFVDRELGRVPLVVVAPETSYAFALYTKGKVRFDASATSMTGFTPDLPDSSVHLMSAHWDNPGAQRSAAAALATRHDLAWLAQRLRARPSQVALVGCDIDLEPGLLRAALTADGYRQLRRTTFDRNVYRCAVSLWERSR